MAAGKKDVGNTNHVSGSTSTGSPSGGSTSSAAAASSASPASSPASSGHNASDIYDYFVPGSVVRCVTCSKKNLEGEVMAFDPNTRILILSNVNVVIVKSWA